MWLVSLSRNGCVLCQVWLCAYNVVFMLNAGQHPRKCLWGGPAASLLFRIVSSISTQRTRGDVGSSCNEYHFTAVCNRGAHISY